MAVFNDKEILLAGLKGDSCFIRYSAYEDGTDFTETLNEGQDYIGIAAGSKAPTDKSGYQWSLFRGTRLEEAIVAAEAAKTVAETSATEAATSAAEAATQAQAAKTAAEAAAKEAADQTADTLKADFETYVNDFLLGGEW
jgi:hypothetical protein